MGGFVVGVGIVLLLSSTSASAGGDWWQKGAGMLNALQGKSTSTDLPADDLSAAFKEALRVGSDNVVRRLGAADGFNGDPAVHIPLPPQLAPVKGALARVGMSGMVDDLELRLNRAAEAATPKAKALFVNSISEMTFDDVKSIYGGEDDAATRYFQGKMSPSLKQEMSPVVAESLSRVGAVQAFDRVMGKYKSLPFVPDVKANLTDYVVQKGMDGIFLYLAKEEAAIREDPARQTTDLLKRVFGAK